MIVLSTGTEVVPDGAGSPNKMNSNLSLSQRREIRNAAHAEWANVAVVVVAGAKAPEFVGEGFHYETMGGTRVRHPSAYAKKGWSNLRYVCSTYRVEVGAEWVAARFAEKVAA